MAIEYRDYGSILGFTAPQVKINDIRHTQVYTVTHDGAGKRLPYMNRAFISFSYGGKNIEEDFNLIAITENNLMLKKIYAEFEDDISTNDVVHGQLFWGSRYKTNEFSFTLFTDGITERLLGNFKEWFRPGIYRELILAEHPNRGILARVAEAPEYHMLAFEEKTTMIITGIECPTSTTVYKGRIDLKLVADEPFWYSLTHILDALSADGGFENAYWRDANGKLSHIFKTPDAVKILLEDGVPLGRMYLNELTDLESSSVNTNSILVGTNKVLIYADTTSSRVGSKVGVVPSGTVGFQGAEADWGHVRYHILSKDGNIELPTGASNKLYFYYPGTAPAYPIIKFTCSPTIENNHIVYPRNDRYKQGNGTNSIYIVKGDNTKALVFTTPGLWTAYNLAAKIVEDCADKGFSVEEVRVRLREGVKHYLIRNRAIQSLNNSSNNFTSGMATTVKTNLTQMLNGYTATFIINCKTGEVIGEFQYKDGNKDGSIKEECGDMILSSFPCIEGRDYFNDNGYITQSECHYIYHNSNVTWTNFSLEYDYMYL